MPPSPPLRTHPAHALCAYAEPLAEARRVVVVGDASLDLGGLLVRAGARVVHVYDPDAERAREYADAERGVVVRALAPDRFDVRDGAFDLAIVPDLAAVPDPPALLARVRRLLAIDGALLVATKNPAVGGLEPSGRAIDYAELYDMVALQFANVRMIGQVPFVGMTMAELGDTTDEPEVSVDTQLGPEERTPHAFVALASQNDVRLAPYALVELEGPARGAATSAPAEAIDDATRAALAETTLRADVLAAQLEEARSAVQRALADAEATHARRIAELEQHVHAVEARSGEHVVRAERLAQEVAALEQEVERQRRRAVDLEEQAADYKKMRAHAEVGLSTARATIRELDERVASMTAALDAARAAAEENAVDPEAIAALAERAARGEEAEAVVRQLEADFANVGELHAEELGAIEALLRERARTIQELELELGRRERLVKELVRALEEQHAPAPPPDAAVAGAAELDAARRENAALRERLDAMAREIARREADSQSLAWRLTELEERLAKASAAPPGKPAGDSPGSADLARAQVELDALRQALAQEHEARARLESGEALARAHAELARQAALIEQLSRELDARDRMHQAEA